ncbi:MAG: dienelactone hydrolase family protein [Anaerolineae bacterium]|nr:dienelactone hydrolase family protein [Anaerolineae bacterium]
MKVKLVSLAILLLLSLAGVSAQESTSGDVEVTSGGQAYPSYLAAPTEGGPYPGIILIHSFRGLEEGYKTMVDQLAAEGFVVLAVGWQTFEQSPPDETVKQLIEDSILFLSERDDVDPERLGLTGFCAGGRYTMLLLPQIDSFKAGVAWYGFPTNGAPAPVDLVADLTAPMLIIHGTADEPSPIADIYNYANTLTEAGAAFELKVYSGEPHGFMLSGGELRQDEVAQDAYREMADFFKRKL